MKYKTILVCGLPGAGKTYFSNKLKETFGDDDSPIVHINGDDIRSMHNDWDFSEEGRKRQAERMRKHADEVNADGKHVILDFVCPKQEYRDIIKPDILVWANRTPVRDFPDTTAMFEPPKEWDYRLIDKHDEWDYDGFTSCIWGHTEDMVETTPTALMIGRFQPWHDGHTALFKKALEKHGQVCIAVRTMRKSANNPFDFLDVWENIMEALDGYEGRYEVIQVPNIVDVVYGRDVGWTVSKIDLPPEIEAISATKIRKAMKNGN